MSEDQAEDVVLKDLDAELAPFDRQAEPVEEFGNYGWLELRRFLKAVSASLPWGEFLLSATRIGLRMPDVHRVALVAANDLFGAFDDMSIMVRLKVPLEKLQEYRGTDLFVEVTDAILATSGSLAKARTLEEVVAASETAVARRTMNEALFSPDGRSRSTASTAINDRLLAKKGREEGQGREFLLPEGMLELMKGTLELQRRLEEKYPERTAKIIDARVVHEITDGDED